MPLPESKFKAVTEFINAEFLSTPAPFFGVNVIDVNEPNLAEFAKHMEGAAAGFRELPGFSTFHRSVRDYGTRKRMLVINRYDEDIDPEQYRSSIAENAEAQAAWHAACQVIEDYEFWTTREFG